MAYDINSIQSLDWRTGVRTRIQMYLGTDDIEGTYQALKEIINNSTDEAIAGYGKEIEISVSERMNEVTVRDYGRGVPFGMKGDENVLVSIYTKSHTGGKFDSTAYKNASGLNGVGGSCVCLSSKYFVVTSIRDGKKATAEFNKGILQNYSEKECVGVRTGTIVTFSPDEEVFKNGKLGYSYERICKDIEDISYLYSGISFKVINADIGKTSIYCAKNGIVDFVKKNIASPLNKHIIHRVIKDGNDSLEIAFQWGSKKEEPYVFVNGLRCPELGTPITGAKSAITRTFNSLSKQNFDGDRIRENLFYVVNCSVENPSFANQTKGKINNANLRTMASNCFSDALKEMAFKYKDEFDTIVELLKKVEKAEAAAEKARQQVLNASKEIEKNQKRKVFASDKLKDAEFLGENSTLLIVEGKSALGGIAQARDYTKYGLMGIKGKMLNCLSNPEEKIFKNEEIKLLLSAMNIVPGKYNSKKLRYGKLGICVDADSDGRHIALLIMACIAYFAADFIKEGRLCWLRSPLYIVNSKNEESYYFSDEEFNLAKAQGKIKGEVTRAKGLGELSAETAKRSMFSEKYQRLEVIEYDEQAIDLLYQLMGIQVEPRRNFIMENVDFSEIHE